MPTLQELVGDLPTVEPAEVAVEETPEVQVETSQEEVQEPKEETPTATEAPQVVPLPVHMDLKHDMRELKQEYNQLKQQLQSLQHQPAQEEAPEPDPVLSYMDSYKKEYYEENGEYPDEKSIPVPGAVILERDAWRDRQSQKTQAQTAAQIREQAIATARATMTDAAFGEGLGIDSVVAIGEAFLTEGDKLDIKNAGAQCADVMYRRCYDRAVSSGTPQGIALAQKMQAALHPKQPTVKGPPRQPEAPSAEEVLERPRHSNLANLGLVG